MINIKKIVSNLFLENTYILTYSYNNDTLIIDPGKCDKKINKYIESENLNIKYILLTHGHIDHIFGLPNIIEQFPSAKIFLHKDDFQLYNNIKLQSEYFKIKFDKKLPSITNLVKDNDSILFYSLKLNVLHTPGHTKGSICFYDNEYKIIFTGDTIISDSNGYSNLIGSSDDPEEIYRSINDKILPIDINTTVYSGHYEESTIKNVRENIKVKYE